MLSFWGFLIIAVMLSLVLTKKVSIHFGLTVAPMVIALIAGFDLVELGEYMSSGLSSIAQTGIMLTFAILFFGILYDAGLFDPIIKYVIRISKGDPIKIAIGTVVIAAVAHLDGSGSSTYLIAVSALLPIYLSLKMRPLTLVLIVGLTAGVMNIVPWGGPTIRAATSLELPITELFNPLIPVFGVGLICVTIVAIHLGRQEKKRIAKNDDILHGEVTQTITQKNEDTEKERFK